MNHDYLKECTDLSKQEKIKFPELVMRLYDHGIEAYYADLLNSNKTYYSKNEAVSVPCVFSLEKQVDQTFHVEKVVQAIRSSQSGQIKYQEFIKQVMQAGVIAYFVFIKGRKAIYFGRKGEQHTEHFPA